MKKNIDFIMSGKTAKKYGYSGEAKRVSIECEVDLDALSPAARAIAENICTTYNRDDLSDIRLEGPSLIEWATITGNEKECEKLERVGKVFGKDYIERPQSTIWPFDYLRNSETPEEYFERQVEYMRENHWLRIASSTRNKNINVAL